MAAAAAAAAAATAAAAMRTGRSRSRSRSRDERAALQSHDGQTALWGSVTRLGTAARAAAARALQHARVRCPLLGNICRRWTHPPRPCAHLRSRPGHPLARSDGRTQHHLTPHHPTPPNQPSYPPHTNPKTKPTAPTATNPRRRRRRCVPAPPQATPARPTLTRLAPRYGRRNAARSATCRGQSETTAAAATAAVERCGPWRRR